MPKKFTEKKVKKRETVHPRSRKADQLNRAKLRKNKIDFAKERLLTRKNVIVLRLSWFQEILKDCAEGCPSAEDLNEWIKIYIDRFDDELETLKAAQRPNRPIPVKVDQIKMAKQQELDEFSGAGFEMANVSDPISYKKFMEWDGTFGSLHLIKLVRYKRLREDLNDDMKN